MNRDTVEEGTMRNDVVDLLAVEPSDTAGVEKARPVQPIVLDGLAYGAVLFFVLSIVWTVIQ